MIFFNNHKISEDECDNDTNDNSNNNGNNSDDKSNNNGNTVNKNRNISNVQKIFVIVNNSLASYNT